MTAFCRWAMTNVAAVVRITRARMVCSSFARKVMRDQRERFTLVVLPSVTVTRSWSSFSEG